MTSFHIELLTLSRIAFFTATPGLRRGQATRRTQFLPLSKTLLRPPSTRAAHMRVKLRSTSVLWPGELSTDSRNGLSELVLHPFHPLSKSVDSTPLAP